MVRARSFAAAAARDRVPNGVDVLAASFVPENLPAHC
jgi:hypothetical protein